MATAGFLNLGTTVLTVWTGKFFAVGVVLYIVRGFAAFQTSTHYMAVAPLLSCHKQNVSSYC